MPELSQDIIQCKRAVAFQPYAETRRWFAFKKTRASDHEGRFKNMSAVTRTAVLVVLLMGSHFFQPLVVLSAAGSACEATPQGLTEICRLSNFRQFGSTVWALQQLTGSDGFEVDSPPGLRGICAFEKQHESNCDQKQHDEYGKYGIHWSAFLSYAYRVF